MSQGSHYTTAALLDSQLRRVPHFSSEALTFELLFDEVWRGIRSHQVKPAPDTNGRGYRRTSAAQQTE